MYVFVCVSRWTQAIISSGRGSCGIIGMWTWMTVWLGWLSLNISMDMNIWEHVLVW